MLELKGPSSQREVNRSGFCGGNMLKENDFIEVEYTGKIIDRDQVFDTTDKTLAKESGIHNENAKYGAVIVCLGNGHLLAGLDKQLIGKEAGRSYDIILSPEEGFGKKRTDLIQLISTAKFKKQGIAPSPGLQLNIDGVVGTIKTVNGGRTLVDFNHPLSGRKLAYSVTIKKQITDAQQKVEAFIRLALGMPDTSVAFVEGTATVETNIEIPKEAQKTLTEGVQKVIPEVKELVFKQIKKELKE